MTLTLPRGLPSPETPVTVPLKVSEIFGARGDGQADGAERGRGARGRGAHGEALDPLKANRCRRSWRWTTRCPRARRLVITLEYVPALS